MRGQNGSHAKVLDCALDDEDDIASGMIFMSLIQGFVVDATPLPFQSGFQEMSSRQFVT